jgi:hypothetical protein
MSTDSNNTTTNTADSQIDAYVTPPSEEVAIIENPKPTQIVEEVETELKTIVVLQCPPDKIEAAKSAIIEAAKSGTLVLPEGVGYTVDSVPAFSSFVVQDVAKVYKLREKSV